MVLDPENIRISHIDGNFINNKEHEHVQKLTSFMIRTNIIEVRINIITYYDITTCGQVDSLHCNPTKSLVVALCEWGLLSIKHL